MFWVGGWVGDGRVARLLMVQKSQGQPPGMYKILSITGIKYQPQLVRRISAINSKSGVLSVHFFRSVFGSPFG